MKPTVEELRKWALKSGCYDDIFTRADLRLPQGVRVLRDTAQIQEWLDGATWGAKAEELDPRDEEKREILRHELGEAIAEREDPPDVA